jgi:thymidylate kinase
MSSSGKLVVFEGVDEVGKSTLILALQEKLRREDHEVLATAFPGNARGTLGKLVHELHHQPQTFGIAGISPASLQVLHVAAHLETIQTQIAPALNSGKIVLLSRWPQYFAHFFKPAVLGE